jgi:uncharacterized protein (TIGR03545 family)
MKLKLFRWQAIVPLLLLMLLLFGVWLVYSDRVVEHTIEDFGAELVGARVDLESADLRLADGVLRLTGLQVADPNSPMRNLLEADEIAADISWEPLLRKKVHIQRAAMLGVRFGTPRTESGELENPSPSSGRLLREISDWADAVRIPPLGLEALRAVVNVDAIAPESLRTITQARAAVVFADSARQLWETELSGLNPQPLIDSARTLAERLRRINPLQLGLGGATQLVNSARGTLSDLGSTRDRIAALNNAVTSGVGNLTQRVRGLSAARQDDYRYASSLLRLPSLESPELSRSIFGEMAVERLRPVLYWLGRAERFLPPGLDPRRYRGPKRPRRSGVTKLFPEPQGEPKFLLELAEVGLQIGGSGAAAGEYTSRITGVTSEPAIYGRPLTAFISRTTGAEGSQNVRLNAVVDRTGSEIRDSAAISVAGIRLPQVDLNALGARLDLNQGSTNMRLDRTGGNIVGRWTWTSDSVTWSRLSETQIADTASSARGTVQQIGRDLLWRTVSSLRQVEIDVRFSGSVTSPRFEVGSNVGGAVARALREQLGAEIDRAQREVYARVDQLVNSYVSEASAKADALETEVANRVGVQLEEINVVRDELERALRRLIPRP